MDVRARLATEAEISLVAVPANAGAIRDSLDAEKSFMSPKLQKALQPFAAVAKGRCFSGYCPCPPCEDSEMTKKKNAAVLTSGLPGAKACHKSYCTCKSCKSGKTKKLPEETNAASGAEAAGTNEERHEHEEEHAEDKGLQESVAAKMPKLMECGYTEPQSMCLAAHLHSKGNEGEDITGHEEAAKALGYSKDDMGGEEMSLKSLVKAMKKEHEAEALEDADEGETATASEGKKPDDEEEEKPEYKPSAKMLGHMHNHMKNAHDYLSKELPKMDHEKIAKAMTAHCKDLEGHMENYKSLAEMHHPDVDFDKMCKSLGGGGEAEEVENEDGAGESSQASSEEENGRKTDDESPAEKVREYQHPKGAKKRVQKAMMDHGCVKEAADYMADAGRDATMPRVHKAAMMHHCSALTGYCKAMDAPAEAVEHGDPNEVPPEAMKQVAERFDQFADLIFQKTGQRF